MEIVGGYSQFNSEHSRYTVYYLIYEGVVWGLEINEGYIYKNGKLVDTKVDGYPVLGKLSTVHMYHKDNSTVNIPMDPEWLITGNYPEDYVGRIFKYEYGNPLAGVVQNEFIEEFKNFKSYERERKIDSILKL